VSAQDLLLGIGLEHEQKLFRVSQQYTDELRKTCCAVLVIWQRFLRALIAQWVKWLSLVGICVPLGALGFVSSQERVDDSVVGCFRDKAAPGWSWSPTSTTA
jgi:hypothetical protein